MIDTDAPLNYETTYLGMYCHGDGVNPERAPELMALDNAYLWAIVPDADGVRLTVRRRDRLTVIEQDRAETWQDRNYHAIAMALSHRQPSPPTLVKDPRQTVEVPR